MKQAVESPLDRDLSGTYLFISFDLVNSTAFKLSNPDWPPLFSTFFEQCQIATSKYFPKCQTWKMVGDEILFYLPVEECCEIIEAPPKVYSLLQKSITHLETESVLQDRLSVKATLWAAAVNELRHSEVHNNCANYLIKNHQNGNMMLDFLGPDIDTGFRLGTYAIHGKLTISASLTYLIAQHIPESQKKQELDRYRIISLEKLKGVWNGRHYPIIWYNEEWDKPEKLFYYDEHLTSPLVGKIITQGTNEIPNIEKIHKIFRDLPMEDRTEILLNGIDTYKSNNWGKKISYQVPSERLSELHLVAFCFNEDEELLIGRSDKEGLWDFGLSHLLMSKSIEESLIFGYQNDFGVTLEEIHGEFPPVATYSVVTPNWEKRTIPGIMCLADISNQTVSADSFRYKAVRFITEKSAENIDPSECVEGFHERVTMAFETLRRIRKKCY